MAVKSNPFEENTIRGMPNSAARFWVQPRNESEIMSETGFGLDRAQESKGSISPTRVCMKAWNSGKGRSFAFSTPEGIDGCEGKGITRVSIELGGHLARRGERRGRLAGVTAMVRERPRTER